MRHFHFLALSLFCFLTFSFSAAAETYTVTGPETKGGDPFAFIERINGFDPGDTVMINAPFCASSCAFYLGLQQRDVHLCVANARTRFIFHRFVYVEDMVIEGGILKSFTITGPASNKHRAYFWNQFPRDVRRMILARSNEAGLPRHGNEVVITARELGVPTC